MRAVLTLYLINVMSFNNSNATIFFHAFTVLAYTSPLLGSILADGYIGKFWTIFSISIVYAAGQIILAVSSTVKKGSNLHPMLDIAGLVVIAIGTGGIKPCVSAFGGDQFPQHYTKMISVYFSIFYFMINFGSTISMIITPEFRTTPCLGYDSCYPLAFGVPAVLMLVATGCFMAGSFAYIKHPPKENVAFRVVGVIKNALVNKIKKKQTRDHWLEHYLDTHSCLSDPRCIEATELNGGKKVCVQAKFVEDVKSLVRVCVMMLPVPVFWSLYDQQGTKWIIQAVAMDATVWKGFNLLPDQMGVLNAVFILIAIPLFQGVVYPLVEKCGIKTTLLRRMATGGLIAAGAFVVAGFVQVGVNQTLPDIPASNQAFFSVINGYPNCDYNVSISGQPSYLIPANGSLFDDPVVDRKTVYRFNSVGTIKVSLTYKGVNAKCPATINQDVELKGGKSLVLFISSEGTFVNKMSQDKPQEGEGESSATINFMVPCTYTNQASIATSDKKNKKVDWPNSCNKGPGAATPATTIYDGRIAVCKYPPKDKFNPCDPRSTGDFYSWRNGLEDTDDEYSYSNYSVNGKSSYQYTRYDANDIKPNQWKMYYINYTLGDISRTPASTEIEVVPISNSVFEITGMGGVYQYTLYEDKTGTIPKIEFNTYQVVPKNHVSILWQVPQYVVITVAEILFSITGLEFAYSQAAPSMKSVVQAIWLLTVAFGDLIIIIIEILDIFENRATEMFAYAGAMVVVIGIFTLLSIFYYDYVDYSDEGREVGPKDIADESTPVKYDASQNHGYESTGDSE
uniref:Peptide transporter family 1 n=1 Tax=Rhabditophanes sp. KR3021 TaxID=114890 RepID=A0AC35U4S8_9BILA